MRSPIKWVGGKSKVYKKLLPLIPKHEGYVEVFGGSGIVLLNKEPSKWEVFNDFDGNLINFWSVIQNAHEEFINSFEWEVVSRKKFEDYKIKYKNNDYYDAIERAKIFYYLVKASYGSDMVNPSFGTGTDRSRLRLEQIEKDIKNTYERIKKVTIENKSFEYIFDIYESISSIFFLDCPYREKKQYPVGKFTDEMYIKLAECCKKTPAKWLCTINDDKFIRELFKGFNIIEEHEVFYSSSKLVKGRKKNPELIITNYDIPKVEN